MYFEIFAYKIYDYGGQKKNLLIYLLFYLFNNVDVKHPDHSKCNTSRLRRVLFGIVQHASSRDIKIKSLTCLNKNKHIYLL